MLKILFVGSSAYPMYAAAFLEAARELPEVDANLFDVEEYMRKKSLIHRIERNVSYGPNIKKINRELLKRCYREKYDLVFFYTAREIFPKTIKKIGSQGSYIALYNNDNPFSDAFRRYFWRHYRNSIKYADITYVYRGNNMKDAAKYGAHNVKLLRSYYIKEFNYYVPDENIDLNCPDVVFLGHLEADERVDYIRALLDLEIYVGVPKKSWDEIEVNNKYLIKLEDTHKNYNLLLNKSKIAIAFLSKINQDTYTRRCFEIPAAKTMMVAPYTDDLATLYVDGEEVSLYKNKEDFVEKITYYLENESKRVDVAENGYDRVMSDGHEAKDRVLSVINDYNEMR